MIFCALFFIFLSFLTANFVLSSCCQILNENVSWISVDAYSNATNRPPAVNVMNAFL